MQKKRVSPKNKKFSLSIEDLKKVLFTKDDALGMEQKTNEGFASIERQMTAQSQQINEIQAELRKRPAAEDVRRIINTELNKVWMIEEDRHKKHERNLKDHDERIAALGAK